MIIIPLTETPIIPQDTPLQRVGYEGAENEHTSDTVYTIYMQAFCNRRFKSRPIVNNINPAKWPYIMEIDCNDDWNTFSPNAI